MQCFELAEGKLFRGISLVVDDRYNRNAVFLGGTNPGERYMRVLLAPNDISPEVIKDEDGMNVIRRALPYMFNDDKGKRKYLRLRKERAEGEGDPAIILVYRGLPLENQTHGHKVVAGKPVCIGEGRMKFEDNLTLYEGMVVMRPGDAIVISDFIRDDSDETDDNAESPRATYKFTYSKEQNELVKEIVQP